MSLTFEDTGGNGIPLLLLHAFPLTARSFRPQLEGLGKTYRLIAPNHRGFGGSASAPGPARMEDMAEDALGLLDKLGIAQAVVGGASMGGYVAMALLRHDPGRVKGLLLMGTQLGADDEAGKLRREDTARALETRGMNVLVESLLPRLLSPSAAPELRHEVEEVMRSVSPASAAAATRGMALRQSSEDILARHGGPALVMVGKDDVITPPERAREMIALMPRASLLEVEHAGHLVNLEAPSVVNDAIGRFLAAIGE